MTKGHVPLSLPADGQKIIAMSAEMITFAGEIIKQGIMAVKEYNDETPVTMVSEPSVAYVSRVAAPLKTC